MKFGTNGCTDFSEYRFFVTVEQIGQFSVVAKRKRKYRISSSSFFLRLNILQYWRPVTSEHSAVLETCETDSPGGVKVKMAESPTKSRKPTGNRNDNQSRLQNRPK